MIANTTGLSRERMAGMVEHLVVTRGDQGAEADSGGTTYTTPVVPAANAVDPTGAGDAFRGGLIRGLAQGVGIVRAMQLGAVCGHYAVQVNGTQTYRYTAAEFEAKLRESFGG